MNGDQSQNPALLYGRKLTGLAAVEPSLLPQAFTGRI